MKLEKRIMFKILLLVYKCVTGQCSENLQISYKSHNCRPQDELLLETKKAKTKFGERTFDYVGPRLWNALPVHVRTEKSIDAFKVHIKTMLFKDRGEFRRRAFKYD